MLPVLAPAWVCAARRITSASLSVTWMLPARPLLVALNVDTDVSSALPAPIPVAAASVVTALALAAKMQGVRSPASTIAPAVLVDDTAIAGDVVRVSPVIVTSYPVSIVIVPRPALSQEPPFNDLAPT